jgi:hypothetical protein
MVKRRKNNTKKKRNGKGCKENGAKARKINASTEFETCTEQLSPFGGLLPLIKFFLMSPYHFTTYAFGNVRSSFIVQI